MNFDCCLNCNKRHVGCHSECKDYIERKKEHDILREKIRKKKHAEDDIYYVSIKQRVSRSIRRTY